jgi:transposase
MDVLYEACCGLDVQAATVVACVRRRGARGRRTSEVRTFGTSTAKLLELADWLTEHRVTHVAMESTGVLWKPVFNILEGAFTVLLVNAPHIKAVPGRKTDVRDSEWLAQLLEHGLLRASFIPPPEIRALRDLTRRRKGLIEQRASEVNRVQRLLESANSKRGLVATDILGASGRARLRALVAGERDGAVLAELAKGTLRQKRARLAEALTGRFTAHHALLWDDLLTHSECLDEAIERLSQHIAAALEPHAEQVEQLASIPGVNQQAAELIIGEIGLDMSQFPTAGHLASWTGICPGKQESAGKRQTGKTRQGNRWLKNQLVECGWGAGRARYTYPGAQYARLSHRRGKKKAVLAAGHSIAVAVYHVLRDAVPYHDLGPDHFDRLARERLTRHYVHRLEQLGHQVRLEASVEPPSTDGTEPGAA